MSGQVDLRATCPPEKWDFFIISSPATILSFFVNKRVASMHFNRLRTFWWGTFLFGPAKIQGYRTECPAQHQAIWTTLISVIMPGVKFEILVIASLSASTQYYQQNQHQNLCNMLVITIMYERLEAYQGMTSEVAVNATNDNYWSIPNFIRHSGYLVSFKSFIKATMRIHSSFTSSLFDFVCDPLTSFACGYI